MKTDKNSDRFRTLDSRQLRGVTAGTEEPAPPPDEDVRKAGGQQQDYKPWRG